MANTFQWTTPTTSHDTTSSIQLRTSKVQGDVVSEVRVKGGEVIYGEVKVDRNCDGSRENNSSTARKVRLLTDGQLCVRLSTVAYDMSTA